MRNKKGISIIVLIITIIVIIILAAVVILTLSKNNPIESAKEARFKEDVRTFQDELALAVSKQYTAAGGHRDEKISTSAFNEIQDYIPSFSEKYKDKFIIQDDELRYTYLSQQEILWCNNLGIKSSPYIKLEYIESTGKQWIETNVNSNNAKIDITCLFTKINNTSQVMINCIKGTKCWFGLSGDGRINVDRTYIDSVYNQKNTYTIEYKNNIIKLSDINGNINQREGRTEIPFCLFSANGGYGSFAKLYGCQIYDNDELVRDYIPVLDQNKVPCLYDKVENKFYYDQGNKEEFKYEVKN